jgi:DedD protein
LDEQLKQRLIGAAVIIALIVIFVPMLLDQPVDSEQVKLDTRIPAKPKALQQEALPSQEILPKPIPPEPDNATSELVQPSSVASQSLEMQQGDVEPAAAEQVSTRPEPLRDDGYGDIQRSSPSAWLIQVASFTKPENAARLVQRLKQADMPAQLEEVTIGGKRHYRVQMLPQLNRKDAEILINRIKQEFELEATLLRYPD